jgi:DNA/RNA endonuclease G (NUC1)
MDVYDCGCDSTALVESFYYSNVTPQLPSLIEVIGRDLKITLENW